MEAVGCGAIAAGLSAQSGAGPGANRRGEDPGRTRGAQGKGLRMRDPSGRGSVSTEMDLPSDLLFAEVMNVSPHGARPQPVGRNDPPGGDHLHLAFLRAGGRDAFRAALDLDEVLPVEVVRGRVVEMDRQDDPLRVDGRTLAGRGGRERMSA